MSEVAFPFDQLSDIAKKERRVEYKQKVAILVGYGRKNIGACYHI